MSGWPQPPASASSEELAAAAHAGNEAAFGVLYRRWVGPLYGIFTNPSRMPADSLADADVLVVDTLSEAWKSLRTAVPRDFHSWIARIASRQWAAYLSAKKRAFVYETDALDAEDPVIEVMFRGAEQRASWDKFITLVSDAIESLPAEYHAPLRTSLQTGLVGQALATEIGSTRRQADRWRSEGLRRLYNAVAVTAMAQGSTEVTPCPRFRRLVERGGWQRGPLGEPLCNKLVKHISQCAACTGARDRLKTTLELIPAFVLIVVPAELLLAEHPEQPRKPKQKDNGTGSAGGASPAARNPAAQSGWQTAVSIGQGIVQTVVGLAGLAVVAAIIVAFIQAHHHSVPGAGAPGAQATLNVWMPSGSVTVTSSPQGLSCTSICHQPFTSGTQLTLTSDYQPGSLPLNWVGCDNTTESAADPCTVTLNQDTAVCVAPYDPSQPNLFTPADCASRAAG